MSDASDGHDPVDPPQILQEWWAWCNAHPHALDTVAKRPAAVIDALWERLRSRVGTPQHDLKAEILALEDRICADDRVPEEIAVAVSSFAHRLESRVGTPSPSEIQLWEAFEQGHWAWPSPDLPTRRALFEHWLATKPSPPSAGVPPSQPGADD